MCAVPNAFAWRHFHKQADHAAARVVGRYHLPPADRDDIRQELLVDLLARLEHFDSSRGTHLAFSAVVLRHGVARLTARLRRDREVFAPVSLDDPVEQHSSITQGDTFSEADGYLAWIAPSKHPITALHERLSLASALGRLSPEQVRLCTDLLTGSVGQARTDPGRSRATLYRQLQKLRLCLLAAGVAAGDHELAQSPRGS